jgi:4-amino-4-deoxy-L-arabinose transferase-like glycosyltransferase
MRRPRAASLRARFSNGRSAPSDRVAPLRAAASERSRTRASRDWLRAQARALRRPENASFAAVLLLIAAIGLWLRLRNNGYGLPYVYNYDEATHFTDRAVNMFGGSLDPGYYQNPAAFTYLVFVVLKLKYGLLSPIFGLEEGSVGRQFFIDPTPIWETSRALAAFLAILGVVATGWVGRRLLGAREGMVAAAVLAFAFLPVAYSRIAVTDVGTFLPVAVAVYGAVRVYEEGRLRWYLVTGAATGLAIGFKYTAGLVLLPLLLAAGLRAWRDPRRWRDRADLRYALGGLGAMVAAVFVTNPYVFFRPVTAAYQLKQQAEAAGGIEKLGQEQQGGYSYYLESLTWGLGWAACFAALAGAVILVRRDRLRAALLLLFPIALFIYMGAQTRYFGRWLLPMYPVLALLCGVAVARLADLARGRRALAGAIAAAALAVLLVQPVASSWRTSEVLGKEDTRQSAREFLEANYRKSLRIVIEPGVPENYYRLDPEDACKRRERARGETECPAGRRRQFVFGFVRDIRRQANLDAPEGASITYAASLTPQTIDEYRQRGFCLVMTMSVIRGRAENAGVPGALEYYDRLERESRLVRTWSPYDKGADPVPLDFDFSYNYYPTAFDRPGPELKLYRLNDCEQRTGKVPNEVLGRSGLDKGVGSSYLGS